VDNPDDSHKIHVVMWLPRSEIVECRSTFLFGAWSSAEL
jgi:hypothetical protein